MLERFIAAQAGEGAKYAGDEPKKEEFRSFTLNAQCPVPLEVLRKGYFNDTEAPDGRTWQWEVWGTDRDVDPDDVSVERKAGQLTIHMRTAWCPPAGWLMAVSRLWPELDMTLEFFVIEMGIEGGLSVKKGEMTQSWEKPLSYRKGCGRKAQGFNPGMDSPRLPIGRPC
ncbi:hypothetical protein ACINK0_18130 (plasmid) [Deinococcus sp. VB343]|uniref:YubB ferredoxin-like domain-containing protein n=1 Tax=Deinococcus sp. VB142 TaxID=3112952 RepID=A0AAU6Q8H5_9DEIO